MTYAPSLFRLLRIAQVRSQVRNFYCLIFTFSGTHPFQLPELQHQHDEAIMQAYVSKDLEIEQLKTNAQQEWEVRKHEAALDLALMVQEDRHGSHSEQWVNKDTLVATKAALLEGTGGIILSDDTHQTLVLSVSISVGYIPGYVFFISFPGCSRVCSRFIFLISTSIFHRLSGTCSWQMNSKAVRSRCAKRLYHA